MPPELDHVFVAASYGAPEMELVRAAGFMEGPTHDHPGQGTASRGVFFENAYLELIWITDPTVAAAPPVSRTRLAQRADPEHHASPFGFGLRPVAGPMTQPPFETWDYCPPYLPRGSSFGMGANSQMLDEPLVFLLPWAREPSWEVPAHPAGAREVTGVGFGPSASNPSTTLSALIGLGMIFNMDVAAPLLRLELDSCVQGRTCDLRPHLPMTIHW